MQHYTDRPASTPLTNLILKCYPGADGSEQRNTLYEDDGITTEYLKGKYATTDLIYKREGGNLRIEIAPTKGEYDGQEQHRSYTIDLHGIKEIKSVKINNRSTKINYQISSEILSINIGSCSIRNPLVLEITKVVY